MIRDECKNPVHRPMWLHFFWNGQNIFWKYSQLVLQKWEGGDDFFLATLCFSQWKGKLLISQGPRATQVMSQCWSLIPWWTSFSSSTSSSTSTQALLETTAKSSPMRQRSANIIWKWVLGIESREGKSWFFCFQSGFVIDIMACLPYDLLHNFIGTSYTDIFSILKVTKSA